MFMCNSCIGDMAESKPLRICVEWGRGLWHDMGTSSRELVQAPGVVKTWSAGVGGGVPDARPDPTRIHGALRGRGHPPGPAHGGRLGPRGRALAAVEPEGDVSQDARDRIADAGIASRAASRSAQAGDQPVRAYYTKIHDTHAEFVDLLDETAALLPPAPAQARR